MNQKKALHVIMALLLMAVAVSGYLTYTHYAESSVYCLLLQSNDCEAVLGSSYSLFLGIPVAFLAGLLYLILLYFCWKALRKEEMRSKYGRKIAKYSSIAVIAAGYFNIIMFFKLKALCTWCEINHGIGIAVFVLSLFLFYSFSAKKTFFWTAALLSIGIVTAFIPSVSHDQLAQCLHDNNVTMYGAYWCPHCADQKRMFGKSFSRINYVECAVPGSDEPTVHCKKAEIQSYPTWIRADDNRLSGIIPLSQLAEWAGCEEEES